MEDVSSKITKMANEIQANYNVLVNLVPEINQMLKKIKKITKIIRVLTTSKKRLIFFLNIK